MATCRDFICDAYNLTLNKQSASIYGFSWNGEKDSPSWDAVYLLLKFPSKDYREALKHNLPILFAIEKANGIPESAITFLDDSDQAVLVGDKRWLKNMLHLSLYSFFVRVLAYVPIKDQANWQKEVRTNPKIEDSRLFKFLDEVTLTKVFDDLHILNTEEWCGYSKDIDTYSIHHNSGFISIFGSHPEINQSLVKTNKHFKLMKERGLKLYYDKA